MTLHLAQLNIGRLVAPLDDPRMADFVAGLPVVNAIADASPGFVWRLVDDGGADATGVRPFADHEVAINLSVWESVEALRAFMYRTAHLEFLRRRREWFTVFGQPYSVSWWVPVGHRPTVDEALARLELLKANGSTPEAFALRDADLVGSP